MVGWRRRTAATVGVILLALGLGALPAAGAEPTGSSDRLPHLRNMGSARVVVTIHTTKTGKPAVLRSVGVVDFRNKRRQVTTRPRGVYAAEQRELGPDFYARGVPHSPVPTNRPWTHTRSDFVPLLSVQDPADLVRGFRPYRPSVRRMDRRIVRGVATTHYRLASIVPVAPKLRAAGYIGGRGRTDVWIDARGHVRRTRLHVSGLGGSAASTRFTEYFDLGVAVHVARPPAKTVTEEGHGERRERATGAPLVIGSGTAGRIPWTVRFLPTGRDVCTNLASDGRPQSYGVRIRGSELLGAPCVSTARSNGPELQFTLLRNGAQIVSGTVPADTTTVTVRYDDATTAELVPHHGGIAFAIVGDRIATELVPHVPGTTWSCALDAPFNTYRCSGGGNVPPPPPDELAGSPGTAP